MTTVLTRILSSSLRFFGDHSFPFVVSCLTSVDVEDCPASQEPNPNTNDSGVNYSFQQASCVIYIYGCVTIVEFSLLSIHFLNIARDT